ncbi:hypothetical protein [Neobacillus citreus]|uniref:Uncharacterized protein n=1 Tax=Neobacillus citreus TaxID=2833578 RepID=A0A942T3J7_9BACI|nr:hypothetical protein [Neobacillus citreus]MCH6265830.1 hypothetical protein [Neobacillus citreus]
MDKKQKISWGVSFGSLALVAGMMSYLGFSNGSNLFTANQGAAAQQQDGSGNQPQQFGSQSGQGEDSFGSQSQDGQGSFGFRHGHDRFGGDYSGQTNGDNGSLDSSSGFSSDDNGQNQFSSNSDSGFGHHGGFDTTTGGT